MDKNLEMKMDKSLYEDIKYGTNIIGGEEYLNTMMAIADVGSGMVVKTLGPYGKTTIIDDGSFTYPTKDGWSILKRLRFNDPIFNTLYGVLKQVSFDLVNKVGDGTTTAFNGATVFMHKLLEYAGNNDLRQSDFIRILNELSNEIITDLKASSYVRKIDMDGDFEDIRMIADISSNGNHALSDMIQKIYQKTHNPNIYITLDASDRLSYEVQTGYKLDCSPLNQKGYRNNDDGTYTLTEPALVAVFDHNVTYNEHSKIIGALSNYASVKNQNVFILAPHFDDIMTNILGTSINSMLQQNQVPNIMMIQVPLSMSIHRQYLSDLVLLTNAQVFDYGKVRAFNVMVHNQSATKEDKIEDSLLNTDQYKFEEPSDILDMCLGHTRKIIVSEKYLIIQEYENVVNLNVYKASLEEVKKTYESAKARANKNSSALLKEYMDAYQHYTKLFGNMGVIKVGGASELEKHCLQDSVEDAVLACRSATDNGYIRGLNLATLNIIDKCVKKPVERTTEEKDLLNMFRDVFVEMSLTVLRNKFDDTVARDVKVGAGETGYPNLRNRDIIEAAIEHEYGYDLLTETFMEDGECTVINSTLTDIEVLKGIVSILSTMLTSDQFLSVNRNYDRNMGYKQQAEMKKNQKKEETEIIIDTIIDRLSLMSEEQSSGFFAGLRKLFRK